jgi:hypothetical protein
MRNWDVLAIFRYMNGVFGLHVSMLFLIGYNLDHETPSIKKFIDLGNLSHNKTTLAANGTYWDLYDDFEDFADEKVFMRKWMFYSHLLNVLIQLIVDTALLDKVLNFLYYLFKCGSREDEEKFKDADNLEKRVDEKGNEIETQEDFD